MSPRFGPPRGEGREVPPPPVVAEAFTFYTGAMGPARIALEQAIVNQKAKPLTLEARGRAKALLESCLTPKQRKQHSTNGTFVHNGRDNYQFGPYGVTRLDDSGEPREGCCIYPVGFLPLEDKWLALLLLLRADEQEFRRVMNTNKTVYMPDPAPCMNFAMII